MFNNNYILVLFLGDPKAFLSKASGDKGSVRDLGQRNGVARQ